MLIWLAVGASGLPCGVAVEPAALRLSVGDDRLRVVLSIDQGTLQEAEYLVFGRAMPGLSGVPWAVRIDGELHGLTACRPSVGAAGERVFEGAGPKFTWRVRYALSGPGRVTRQLIIRALSDCELEEVEAWRSTQTAPPVVPRTSLQDIAAIYRGEHAGLFVSLDFPYSRIETSGDSTRITYPPRLRLHTGERYEAHSVTYGAIQPTGRMRYGHDEGEVAALDAYVQQRFAPRFERPMMVSCSIVNRYTQPRGGVIWASMKDHPTLRDNTDLLERELALMPRLGVEHYQVFPGVFDWGPNDPAPEQVDRLMEVARAHGVRMGDYSGSSSVFCPHYNEYANHLDRSDWLIVNAEGKAVGPFCFGCTAFVEYYIGVVVPNCKRFGFEMHCLDFLNLQPCHAKGHGHPAGRDSVYHAVRGLVRLLEAINDVSPQMMTWSNSGNWSELLPKIAWSNPNLYLTDPFIATPWQGLNMTRLLDDARREQMVGLHWSHFIPYRFLSNCQYFFSQNSVVPDIRHFEYGALSTLAVTPNLCLGEIRPWLDRLSETDRSRAIAFYACWTQFVRDHFDLWKTTFQAGENPGPGAVEIYAHAAGDRGFVFLVNPQYWSRTVEVPLNEALGFTSRGRCEIAELYPSERLHLTPEGPFASLGGKLRMLVPAQQVVVLEVRPAPATIESPRLYGVAGCVEPTADGYVLKAVGPQGRAQRCAIVLPPGSRAIGSAEVREDVPKLAKRLQSPTPLRFWPSEGGGAVLDIRFRGVAAPDELRDWTVLPGSLDEGRAGGWFKGLAGGESMRFPLFADVVDERVVMPWTAEQPGRAPLGPLAGFCGGYIENAFAETQETWIALGTAGSSGAATSAPAVEAPTAGLRPLPGAATDARTGWWLQTRFALPFMYTIGAEPFFDEHTILVLPMLEPQKVRQITAWINSSPLEVRRYAYPRNRGLGCYYADLVGSGAVGGENTLIVQVTY